MATEPKPTSKKQQQKRRVALGKPIQHTDEELDELSRVTDADIEAATALVRSSSPRLAAMLDAQPKDEEQTNGPKEGNQKTP